MEEEKKYLGGLMINASLDKINLQRQLEFDYVKALAIFGMIIIHVYEVLSLADYRLPVTNFYEGFLQFFGGPMAAPVFTLAMGMGIVYSRNSEPNHLIKRGVKLFLCGYLLNITRSAIPYCIVGGEFFGEKFLYLMLNVDIFHLDGLVFILLGFLRKWKVPDLLSGAIAIVVQAIGFAVIPLINIDSLVGRCLAGLVVFTGIESCFPLTLWFIYIILGVLFAEYLKHVKNLDIFYKRVFVVFAILLPCYCVTLSAMGFDLRNFYSLADDIYYQQNILSFIFTFMVIMLDLSIGHYVLRIADSNGFNNIIRFLSRNLSTIYVIQWILIAWTYFFVFVLRDIDGIGIGWVIPMGLFYLVLAVLITILYNKVKGAIKKSKA